MGFEPLAQEMLHADNPRLTGVGTLIVTLMWVFLSSLGCFYKTRPPKWWVPGEVPPTIKLGLIGRVKSDVLLEHRSFFSFLDGSGGETSRESRDAMPVHLIRSDGHEESSRKRVKIFILKLHADDNRLLPVTRSRLSTHSLYLSQQQQRSLRATLASLLSGRRRHPPPSPVSHRSSLH
ncbi:hypothetical protein B296_00014736 [Ensete ventricosum]|uniref:Uncharacterized protein n=1 Tax=Ensete ventricosum TaxID=4639 RepID=A0A427A3B9_ENSVE|nr:hypothetical protein B296_00014736 [Ensete ventricosum]